MALKCPSSFWAGTMPPNQRAIWLWKATYYGKEIPIGTTLILPVENQSYRFAGVKLWQYKTRRDGSKGTRREMTYTFESQCVICSAPFDFRVPSYFRSVVRTCPAHRRAWRTRTAAPKPERKPAVRDAYSHMGKAQNQVFNSCYESGSMDVESIVAHAQRALAARGEHVLKGNLVRAYRQLIKRGAIEPLADSGADLL